MLDQLRSQGRRYARPGESKVEDFESDLDTLRVRRAALEEQLKKGGADARSLQDQLRNLDAQIAVLEEAMANEDASRDA
jgi:predicted nuclease with TOPRIM domain